MARDAGLSVVLSESAGRLTSGLAWADQVAHQRRSVPFAVLDPAGDPGADVPSTGATGRQGGLAATRHLIGLGRARIGAISGPAPHRRRDQRTHPHDVRPRPRRRLPGRPGDGGAAGRPGLVGIVGLVGIGDFHHEAGYRQGPELLRRPDRPTAVFAGDDLQALGRYEAAPRAVAARPAGP